MAVTQLKECQLQQHFYKARFHIKMWFYGDSTLSLHNDEAFILIMFFTIIVSFTEGTRIKDICEETKRQALTELLVLARDLHLYPDSGPMVIEGRTAGVQALVLLCEPRLEHHCRPFRVNKDAIAPETQATGEINVSLKERKGLTVTFLLLLNMLICFVANKGAEGD